MEARSRISDLISNSFSLWKSEFRLITLIVLLEALINTVVVVVAYKFFEAKTAQIVETMANFLLFVPFFVINSYLYYQVYTGSKFNFRQLKMVLQERAGRVLLSYLYMLLYIMGWMIVIMCGGLLLQGGKQVAENISIIFDVAMVVLVIICALKAVNYAFIPYFALFEGEGSFASFRQKSVDYIKNNQWRMLASSALILLFSGGILLIVMQILQLFGLESALLTEGQNKKTLGIPDIVLVLCSYVVAVPFAILWLHFFIECWKPQRNHNIGGNE